MNHQDSFSQQQQSRIPYSFWIFMINVALIAAGFIVSSIASQTRASITYAVLINVPMILGFTLLSSGVYAGWNYKASDLRRHRLNKIGLWGNGILYGLIIIGLIGSLVSRALP